MSVSFLITKFKSLSFVEIVRHCQQQKGRFLRSATCIEQMCFRISQNLEVNPPNTNDVMSFTLQEPVELSLVNESLSSQCLAPICCLTMISFFSSIDSVLYFFISAFIFSTCLYSSSTDKSASSSYLTTALILSFFLNFFRSSSFLLSLLKNCCFLVSSSPLLKRSSPILYSLGFRFCTNSFLPSLDNQIVAKQ